MTLTEQPKKRLAFYDADQWGSACPVLRVTGPAAAVGWEVLRGNVWSEMVLRSLDLAAVAEARLVLVERDFPRHAAAYAEVISAARAQGKPVIYEVDDLLTEIPADHPSHGYFAEAQAPILAAITEADAVTTSTEVLAGYLRQFNPCVWVLPNYVNDVLWPVRPVAAPALVEAVTIGYVGGLTHAADLEMIAPVLARLAQRYGDRLRLRFWGAPPPAALANLPNVQWTRLAVADYEQYAAYMAQQPMDIGLAPLRDNFFNRCKSSLKYLEYSALAVPGVYSRLDPYRQVVRDGENGLLAGAPDEWEARLLELIEQPQRRAELARQAQATLRADWMLSTHAAQWDAVYSSVLAETPGQRAASLQANTARKAAEWQRALVAEAQAQAGMAQAQQTHLVHLQASHDRLAEQAARLVEITSSPAWGLTKSLTAVRWRLMPKGSRRELASDTVILGLRYWRQAGTRAAAQRTGEVLAAVLPGLVGRVGGRLLRGRDPYQAWIKTHEPGPAELKRQRQDPRQKNWPLISVITPVYNPAPAVLAGTLASVQAQTYTHWELCLVDGGSDMPGVREVLETAARGDPRLKLRRLEKNLGISGNQNAALALASGDYVLVLDHDDLLAPEALYHLAELLSRAGTLDAVYFDEDKISADGLVRREPWFKPSAWSPDLLLSTNILMHALIRRVLLLELGGYDSAVDGAQDWDMALRLTEQPRRLAHIPRVFYHWRQVPGSAARDANAKPWALAAQEKMFAAHLARSGSPQARVTFPSLGRVRVHWPASGARVSIIIPTRDKLEVLRPCLDSIFQHTDYSNYEIVLVDTGSLQPATWAYYGELAAKPAPVTVVRCVGEFNFSTANNLGASRASGDLLLFLNNDIEVLEDDWLTELAGWVERPGVGIVGAKLLRPDGTIQHGGLVMGLAGHASHAFDGGHENTYGPFGSSEWYRDLQAVTGACLMVRRSVFESIGGFDEAYQIGYGDIEICLRAGQAGQRIVYTPFARLLHHEGASRGFSVPPADVLRATLQLLPLVAAGDPYFSPNLSDDQRQPSIAANDQRPRAERLDKILADFNLVAGLSRFKPAAPRVSVTPWKNTNAAPVERRILLVSHELSRSGAPVALANLARYLVSAGYAPAVLAPVDGPLRAVFEAAGIEVQVDPAALVDARVTANRLTGFGVVIANTILAWRAVYAARARQVPCLWWIHESTFGQSLAQRTPAIAKALGVADLLAFPSPPNASLYEPYLKPERQVVIPALIEWPPTDWSPLADGSPPAAGSPQAAARNGKLRLVTIASLEPRKGQDVLLASLAALPPELRGQIELYFLGQILDRRYYRRLLQTGRQYPGVHILGAVPHTQAIDHLAAADIFVLPSRDEALPVALLEAMALSKPIVATLVGGISAAVEQERQALLVPPDDPAALAQALTRLLQNPALGQQLGQAARARFEAHFTFERVGQQVVEHLQGLVEARQLRQLNASLGQREALGAPLPRYAPPPSLDGSTNSRVDVERRLIGTTVSGTQQEV